MSYTSLFKNKAFLFTVSIFVLLEIAVRILPAHYGEGAGVFLTNQRKYLAESEFPEFDYVMLGDSRSLSVMGHPPTDSEPYSFYNFSLPAMGSRYYRFFLEKILENREHPPVAVILSADPQVFFRAYHAPLNDPERIYTDDPQTSVLEYMRNRVVRRIEFALGKTEMRKPNGQITSDMLWDFFSHRYLHLFDVDDIIQNYTGAERVFLLKESIPLLYSTYKYRNSLTDLSGGLPSLFKDPKPLPAYCNACESMNRPECHPRMNHLTDNRTLSKGLQERYGQINLSDRLTVSERMAYLSARDANVENYKKILNDSTPDLAIMEEFIQFAVSRGLKVIVADVPALDSYRDTQYHKMYYKRVQELISKYPQARMIRFPEPYYPVDLFVEQVHYDCLGARKLNDDFYSSVMPRILEFAPPLQDNRIRSFQK